VETVRVYTQRGIEPMKTFQEQYCAGKFYRYDIYKIVDGNWQIYYLAEPCGKGATRIGDSVAELQRILENDAKLINQMHQKIL
jgi:hypothetical protein